MLFWKKILFVSLVTFTIVILLGFVAFSGIFKFMVENQTSLRKHNMIRGFYLKLPMPLDFRIHFFNVSNPEGVQKGETPIVKEIGPYCYDLYKEKIDIVENVAEDSLTYTPFDKYIFNETRCGNLSQDDYVTIINPLLLGMVNRVAKGSAPLLAIVNKAIKAIFKNPSTIYMTVKVRDILFDGILIDCNVTDFSGKAVCTQIKTQLPGLVEIDTYMYRYSLLGPRNGTIPLRIKVSRGIKNSKDLGRVLEVNNQRHLTFWSKEECNRYHGTDGWIFPPFLTEDEGIWTYTTDLCRSIKAKFIENSVYKGLNVRRYYADLGDQSKNEQDKCYCETPKTCLKKGVFSLEKCMNIPIFATLPHFLMADESYIKSIKGLTPNINDHIIKIHFIPEIGVPLEGKKRLQLNLFLEPINKIDLMKNTPVALHPLLWLEEGVVLEGELFNLIKSIFILLKIIAVVKYSFLLITIGGILYAGYLYYQINKKVNITPVLKYESESIDSYNYDNHNFDQDSVDKL